MIEKALIKASAGTGVASTEDTIPEKEKIFAATDIHINYFFDGADIVIEAMPSATVVATKEIPTEAPVPLSGPVPSEESTPVEALVPPLRQVPTEESPPIKGGVIKESAPISVELSTPPKGVVPPVMT